MPSCRTKVRAPLETRGLVALSCTLGIVCGIALTDWPFGIEWFVRLQLPMWYLVVMLLAWKSAPIVVYAIAGALIGFTRRQAIISGSSLAGAMISSGIVASRMMSGLEGLELISLASAFRSVLTITVATIVGGFVSFVIVVLFRTALFNVVQQDGTRCWDCAYPAGRSDSSVCPECGRQLKQRASVVQLVTVAIGRRAKFAVIALLIVIIGSAFLIFRQQVTVRRFHAVFDVKLRPAVFSALKNSARRHGAFIGEPDQFGMGTTAIATLYSPTIFHAPRIRFYGGEFNSSREPQRLAIGHAGGQIWCELNAEQTNVTLASGLPTGLRDELIRVATNEQPWNRKKGFENPKS